MRWRAIALSLMLLFSLPQPAQAAPPWLGRFSSLVRRFLKKPAPVIKIPRDGFPISKKDLFWGRLQVDRMMRDRPAMAKLVHKGDVIYEYAARQFAGASNHRRIIWDSTPPPGKYFADNGRRNGVSRIRVQIHTYLGHKLDAEELWSCAIFELLNSSHQDEWHQQFLHATEGAYLRDEYIWAVASLEYLTAIRTKQFYLTCWEPFLQSKGLPSDPEGWFVDLPATFKEWKESYDRIGYPYDVYGAHYDMALRYRHRKETAEQEYARAVREMEKRLNSREHLAQLAEIERQSSERSYRENLRALRLERSQHPRRNPALERWNASQAESTDAENFRLDAKTEAPATKPVPTRPRVSARPGDHPGETSYSNADDSCLRAHR